MHFHRSRRLTVASLLAASFLATVSPVRSQQAPAAPKPAPPSVAAPKTDELIILSLFTVVSDDKGYQASHTLSGTRLNSKLEDLGSSITVVPSNR